MHEPGRGHMDKRSDKRRDKSAAVAHAASVVVQGESVHGESEDAGGMEAEAAAAGTGAGTRMRTRLRANSDDKGSADKVLSPSQAATPKKESKEKESKERGPASRSSAKNAAAAHNAQAVQGPASGARSQAKRAVGLEASESLALEAPESLAPAASPAKRRKACAK